MVPEHERRLTLFLTVTFAFVGFLIKGFMYYQTLQDSEKNGVSLPSIAVAIISEREHFENRQAIRETWLQDRGTVKTYFVLGSKSCNIHPVDRLDPLSCVFYYPNITVGIVRLAEHTTCEDGPLRTAIGLSFKIRYPMLLVKLGALADLVGVKAHILEATSKRVLREVLIEADRPVDGYKYSRVEPIQLNRGFEGILMLTGNISAHCGTSVFLQSDTLEFSRVYYDHLDENSQPWDISILSGVSAEFIVESDPELSRYDVATRRRQWLNHMDEVERRIAAEKTKHKDILIVNTVDTYRNLPQKMMETFSHFSKTPISYLVKVDDDVVLDLSRLKHILKGSLITNRVIWAKTRRALPISMYGKWAENVGFPSQVYPDFPCGATYVLSKDLVQFIAKNKGNLHYFQGEDVSVGTWLLGTAPRYIGESRFSCGVDDCNENSLNRVEVESPKEMRDIWDVYMKNKTLCVR